MGNFPPLIVYYLVFIPKRRLPSTSEVSFLCFFLVSLALLVGNCSSKLLEVVFGRHQKSLGLFCGVLADQPLMTELLEAFSSLPLKVFCTIFYRHVISAREKSFKSELLEAKKKSAFKAINSCSDYENKITHLSSVRELANSTDYKLNG